MPFRLSAATESLPARETRTGPWLVATLLLTANLYFARTWPLALHLSTHTPLGITTAEILRKPIAEKDLGAWQQISRNDQSLSLWQGAQNARALLRMDFRTLLAQRQCYPMPWAGTLGEHEIEFGILFLPWWALSGEPILSYNLAVLSMLLIAAAGAFLYVHRWTGSVPAAVGAALAFALAPVRLPEIMIHPAVEGMHWIPFLLLALDETIDNRRSIRPPVLLALALLMGSLAGSRPLLVLATVVGPYAVVRLVSQWKRGELRLADVAVLAGAALPAVAINAGILWQYTLTSSNWVFEVSRGVSLARRTDFLFGGPFFPGVAPLLGLLFLGIGQRRSPALALALAASVVFFMCSEGALWPGGDHVRSVYTWLAERFPLVRAARDWSRVGAGATVALQLLGMIGWGRLLVQLAPTMRAVVAGVVVLAVTLQVTSPGWATANFGAVRVLELAELAPPASDASAVREHLGTGDDSRAVLNLPQGWMMHESPGLMLAAYHGRPTSACFQSLTPASLPEVQRLGSSVASPAGIEEAAAAGFGFVVVRGSAESRSSTLRRLQPPPPAVPLFTGDSLQIFELPAPPPSEHDPSVLRLRAIEPGPTLFKHGYRRGLLLAFENPSAGMWSLLPVEPLEARITFTSIGAGESFTTRGLLVPPLAISSSAVRESLVALDREPAPGSYSVTLALDHWNMTASNPELRWAAQP